MAGNHACFKSERYEAEFRRGDRVYDYDRKQYGIVVVVFDLERRGPIEYRYSVDFDSDQTRTVPEKTLIKVR